MEEADKQEGKKSLLQRVREVAKDTVFRTMAELLKERQNSRWFVALMMIISSLQVVAFLFEEDIGFKWKDRSLLLDNIDALCDYARVMPAIEDAGAAAVYWVLYYACVVYLLITFALFAYVVYSSRIHKYYFLWPVKLLKVMLSVLEWILFVPMMSCFVSMLKCEKGYQFIDTSMVCFGGMHIVFFGFSVLLILVLLVLSLLIATFFCSSQLEPSDAFSAAESDLRAYCVVFRTVVIAISIFARSDIGGWIVIIVYIVAGLVLSGNYFAYLPYFNPFTSVLWGSMTCIFLWISLNALGMETLKLNGQLVVIGCGIPMIIGLVFHGRKLRIRHILLLPVEKMSSDIDALNQIVNVEHMIRSVASGSQPDNLMLAGMVNQHVTDCQYEDCVCKNGTALFDAASHGTSKRNLPLHRDVIFLKYYNKRLYEDALGKFPFSPTLRLAFSFYLFDTMHSVQSSLVELDTIDQNKVSLNQQLTIFRYKDMIEAYIAAESEDGKVMYTQLTNIVEFERLMDECQKAIESVCSLQIEFWGQISAPTPDLNVVNDMGKKIFDQTQKAADLWNRLCAINSNHSKALNLYGTYMLEIKNNNQLGAELVQKAKTNSNKKSLDEMIKSSDVLFSEDTAVVHMSASKASVGKIIKANLGITKLFGYTKAEVMGNLINMLMPTLYAKRHTEFLNNYFKTGYQSVLTDESYLYGIHRNGFCFGLRVFIKTMPSLSEGLQYVSMLRQFTEDCDYIITQPSGVIDSFSAGISSLLNLPTIALRSSQLNIQIFAPELLDMFTSAVDKKRSRLQKYKEPGGHPLYLIVPKNFSGQMQRSFKKVPKAPDCTPKIGPRTKFVGDPLYLSLNDDLNKHGGIANKNVTARQLVQTVEYRECDCKQLVRCEILDLTYGGNFVEKEPLKVRVYKIYGAGNKLSGSCGSVAADPRGVSDDNVSNSSIRMRIAQRIISPITRSRGGQSRAQAADQPTAAEKECSNRRRSLLVPVVGMLRPGERLSSNSKKSDKSSANAGRKASGNAVPIDTKGTDKVPGANILSSEGSQPPADSRVARMKFVRDKKTGVLHGTAHMEGKEEAKKRTSNEPAEKPHDVQSLHSVDSETPKDNRPQTARGQVEDKGELLITSIPTPQLGIPEVATKPPSPKEQQQPSVSPDVSPKVANEFLRELGQASEEKKDTPPREEEKKKPEPAAEINAVPREESKGSGTVRAYDSKLDDLIFPRSITLNAGKDVKPSPGKAQAPVVVEGNKETEENLITETVPLQQPQQKLISMTDIHKAVAEMAQSKETHARPLPATIPEAKAAEETEKRPALVPVTLKLPLDKSDADSGDSNLPLPGKSARSGYRPDDSRRHSMQPRIVQRPPARIPTKIITNPIYDIMDNERLVVLEYRQTEEEQKLRKSLWEFENRRNRVKKPEEKKDDKSPSAVAGENKGDEGKKHSDGDGDNEADKTHVQEDKGLKKQESKEIEIDNQDAQSSITSGSTSSTIRSFYSLRAAIDEKYVPVSVRNMGFLANIFFLLLLGLAIAYYVLKLGIYDKVRTNLEVLNNAHQKMISLVNANLEIVHMSIITADAKQHLADPTLSANNSYLTENTTVTAIEFNNSVNMLQAEANKLRDLLTEVNHRVSYFSESAWDDIDPSDIMMLYRTTIGMPQNSTFTLWQAVLELTVGAYRVATLNTTSVDQRTDSNVFLVRNNSISTVLPRLKASAESALSEVERFGQLNINILLALLCVVSFFLLLSTMLLIPVVNKGKRNKQEMLELFMHIKKQDANNEAAKCRRFLGGLQLVQETDMILVDQDEAQGPQEGSQPGTQAASVDTTRQLGIGGTSRRKFKRLVLNLGIALFKFIFLLMIMEGYYLLFYFLSSTFMGRIYSLSNEMAQLVSRSHMHGFLFLVERSAIFEDYAFTINGNNAYVVLNFLLSIFYSEERTYLDVFADNSDYHSSKYNALFNGVVYSDACQYVPAFKSDLATCQEFYQGIMQKGIYSAAIKYGDYMRQLNFDYAASSRKLADRYNYLNMDGLSVANTTQQYYLSTAMAYLRDNLDTDISDFMAKEKRQDAIIFALYVCYLVVVYFLFWRSFVHEMEEEIWRAKSILSVLSPELIMSITEIKTFILSNSSMIFVKKGGRK